MLGNMTCENATVIEADGSPVVSTLMFVAGLVGNVLALAILSLHQRKRRAKTSVFCILVTGLAVTDLLGTCFLSPMVFVCYAQHASLLGLTGGRGLCGFFAFIMTFFILASMLILCAMAVERCLAISHPYFYSKRVRRSFAKAVVPLIYLFTFAFCLLPFLGYGKHKQFCPGTWCFIKMDADDELGDKQHVLAFSLSYASLMALLIVVVFLCNGSVILSLCHMHRSQMSRRGSVVSTGRRKKVTSWFKDGEEEVDHLVLLASMTVIFVICSLPLTGRGEPEPNPATQGARLEGEGTHPGQDASPSQGTPSWTQTPDLPESWTQLSPLHPLTENFVCYLCILFVPPSQAPLHSC